MSELRRDVIRLTLKKDHSDRGVEKIWGEGWVRVRAGRTNRKLQ